eukprot:199708_1
MLVMLEIFILDHIYQVHLRLFLLLSPTVSSQSPTTASPTASPTNPITTAFIFVDQAMTATNAQLHCQNTYNGNLASIHSANENTQITNLCVDEGQTQAACWLGMSKGMSNAES